MQFKVGDIVRNKMTHEEGRIVRIADLPEHGLCYIVAVAAEPELGHGGERGYLETIGGESRSLNDRRLDPDFFHVIQSAATPV